MMSSRRGSQLAPSRRLAVTISISVLLAICARLAHVSGQSMAYQDFPPRLTHQPHSVGAQPGKPQTVECPVESQPESEIKWFKDGRLLESVPMHFEQTGSELMFFQINENDTGDYFCEAQNYLGKVTSEPFRLTVQSAVRDDTIQMEPRVLSAIEFQEQPAEFHCSIPMSTLAAGANLRLRKLASSARNLISWRRNGRRLVKVVWEDEHVGEEEAAADGAQTMTSERFRARRGNEQNEFILSVGRLSRAADDNSTFTCLYKPPLVEGAAEGALTRESPPALLRVEPVPKQPIKLDMAPMGQPIDVAPSLGDNGPMQMQPLDHQLTGRRPSGGRLNHTTQLAADFAPAVAPAELEPGLSQQQPQPPLPPPPPPPQQPPSQGSNERAPAANRIRNSLTETLNDLYQIAKPTLMIFGVLFLVAVIVLFQFLFVRRRAQAHRYVKHHHHHQYSSGSSGSSANSASVACCGIANLSGPVQLGGNGGSGASGALGDCDPMLSSLLARTLSAPSASSLGGAGKKYKFYREHMRAKVAASSAGADSSGSNESPFALDGLVETHDFIDAAAYYAAAAATGANQNQDHFLQATKQAASGQPQQGAASGQLSAAALPNLYNQSLAAREQARSLLQGSELMRSMGNLTGAASSQLQRLEHPLSKQHERLLQGRRADLHAAPSPLELNAASLLMQQQQQQQQYNWSSACNQQQLLAGTFQGRQPKLSDDHYQLVSCASGSAGSSSSSDGTTATGITSATAEQDELGEQRFAPGRGTSGSAARFEAARNSVSSNHYSIIENEDEADCGQGARGSGNVVDEDEDDERYEELDDAKSQSFMRSTSTRSATADASQTTMLSAFNHQRTFNQKSSFESEGQATAPGQRPAQLRASIVGKATSSNRSSTSSRASNKNQAKERHRKGAAKNSNGSQNDQLSPYAVSSICHLQQQQPPPVTSEAMRALNEQFDLNQLILLDGANQNRQQGDGSARLPPPPFSLPPPPAPTPPTIAERNTANKQQQAS